MIQINETAVLIGGYDDSSLYLFDLQSEKFTPFAPPAEAKN